jgi:hypothetical protein
LKRFKTMPSTVVRRFNYLPERHELIVELVTGRRYLYLDVPEQEAQGFRNAFAKGVYFNRRIRSRYIYRELTSAD